MKKILLFTMVLLTMAGMMKAQDVYLFGTNNYYYQWSTVYMPTVWKNGEILYQDGEPLEGYSYYNAGLAIDDETQDVYWYSARSYNNTFERAYLFKNDAFYDEIDVTGNIAPSILGMHYKRFSESNSAALISAGYKHYGGEYYAVIWRNGNIKYAPNFGVGSRTSANDVVVVGDDENNCDYYYCGSIDINWESCAMAWHNDEVYISLTTERSGMIKIGYYDGDIYILGWIRNIETYEEKTVLWKNQDIYFTLEEEGVSIIPRNMVISDGDIWICTTSQHESDAKNGDGTIKIWKNGEVMYEHAQSEYEDSYVSGMDVVNGDVYYVIQAWNDPTCDIYKNGELLYGFNGDDINISALKVYFHDTSSVKETAAPTLSVYPNPANDVIRIENGSDNVVEIYNATGQLMMSVEANNGNISVSGLPAGLYLLKQGASMTQFVKK